MNGEKAFDVEELIAQVDMYNQLTDDYSKTEDPEKLDSIIDNMMATEKLVVDLLSKIGISEERATKLLEDNKIKSILKSLISD